MASLFFMASAAYATTSSVGDAATYQSSTYWLRNSQGPTARADSNWRLEYGSWRSCGTFGCEIDYYLTRQYLRASPLSTFTCYRHTSYNDGITEHRYSTAQNWHFDNTPTYIAEVNWVAGTNYADHYMIGTVGSQSATCGFPFVGGSTGVYFMTRMTYPGGNANLHDYGNPNP